MFEFARAEDAIAYGQIVGLSVALASISLILFLIFRDARLAIVGLVPNAMPLIMIFGLMGILDIPIDAGTVMIGGLALGIAVDDTIHLMLAFVDSVEQGVSSRESLANAFRKVLPSITCSTVMISVGLGVFVLSDFALTRNLGWLTSSVMVICLVADVSLLGALLLRSEWGRLRRAETRNEEGAKTALAGN